MAMAQIRSVFALAAAAWLTACNSSGSQGMPDGGSPPPPPDGSSPTSTIHFPCPFSKFDSSHTLQYGIGAPLGAQIAVDTHFTADNLYLINGDVEITNAASLVIDAGTTICMGPSIVGRSEAGGLRLANGTGSFTINGTATQHVTFTSQSKDTLDYWNGIEIAATDPGQNIAWHFVDIIDGGAIGGGPVTFEVAQSGKGPIVLDHVTFQHMRGKGLRFRDPRGLSADSTVTVGAFDETDLNAGTMTPWLEADAEAAGTFGPASPGGPNRLQFSGTFPPQLEALRVISITSPSPPNRIENDLTWFELGVPYGVTDLGIGRRLTTGAPPTFTIRPGITILFNDFGVLRVGDLSPSDQGILKAIGTANAPITFTSRYKSPMPLEHWASVYFAPNTKADQSEISFAHFQFGGRGGNGGLGIFVCTSNNAGGEIAIDRQETSGLFPGPTITNNVFEDSVADAIRGYCNNLSSGPNCLSTRYDSGSGNGNTFTRIAGQSQSPATCP